MAAEGDRVYARLTVTGTNTGRFFGMPPTGRSYKVNMFDYARLEDGRIVERIQQSDTLSQLGQMYLGAAKKAAAVAGVGLLGRRTARPGWQAAVSASGTVARRSGCRFFAGTSRRICSWRYSSGTSSSTLSPLRSKQIRPRLSTDRCVFADASGRSLEYTQWA